MSSIQKISKQIKFLIIGFWNTLVGIVLMFLLNQIFNERHPQTVFLLASILNMIQSHLLMRKFVWYSSSPYLIEFLKFAAGYIPSYLANVITIQIFVVVLEFNLYVVLVTTSAILAISFYFYQDRVTFKVSLKNHE